MGDPAELIVNAKELVALLRSHAGEPWMTIGGRPFALDAAYTIDALLAALSPAPTVPPGFRLVPVESTERMMEAIDAEFDKERERLRRTGQHVTQESWKAAHERSYTAMLAASPQPPVPDGAGLNAYAQETSTSFQILPAPPAPEAGR